MLFETYATISSSVLGECPCVDIKIWICLLRVPHSNDNSLSTKSLHPQSMNLAYLRNVEMTSTCNSDMYLWYKGVQNILTCFA